MKIEWNILYVSNDSNSLNKLTHLLSKYYGIYAAASIQECMAICKKQDIHLIIVDQELLEQSSMDFLQALHRLYPNMILVLTGLKTNTITLMDAINSGFVHRYIPKPWDNSELTRRIEEALCTFAERQANEHLIHELQCIIDEMKFLHKISKKLSSCFGKKGTYLIQTFFAEFCSYPYFIKPTVYQIV